MSDEMPDTPLGEQLDENLSDIDFDGIEEIDYVPDEDEEIDSDPLSNE
jgi:hypothetical protein